MEDRIKLVSQIILQHEDSGISSNTAVARAIINTLFPTDKIFWTDDDINSAYLIGAFNASGIEVDASEKMPGLTRLHKELERLKELGVEPHELVKLVRYSHTKK